MAKSLQPPETGECRRAAHLTFPVDDQVGQGLELLAVELAVQVLTRVARVLEGDLARALERAGLGDADKRPVERAARQRSPHDRVLASGEEERQRRRSLAQVDAGDLSGLDALARAVEDVVGDLEGDPEREAELAEAAAAEHASGFEELAGLQRTALEIRLHGRVRVVRLAPLQRLATRKAERGVREQSNSLAIAGRSQLGERAGEEVVAGRARRIRAVGRPSRGTPAAEFGAVDQVVVNE